MLTQKRMIKNKKPLLGFTDKYQAQLSGFENTIIGF
jgi:hypothetical protein